MPAYGTSPTSATSAFWSRWGEKQTWRGQAKIDVNDTTEAMASKFAVMRKAAFPGAV
jgi:hypothetical protein